MYVTNKILKKKNFFFCYLGIIIVIINTVLNSYVYFIDLKFDRPSIFIRIIYVKPFRISNVKRHLRTVYLLSS